MVVDESIKHIAEQNERFIEALNHIRALTEERDNLVAEVNQWRNRMGVAAKQSTTVADDFVRQWSSSESLPPVMEAEARRPTHQRQGIDFFDGSHELSLNMASAGVPTSAESTSHRGSGAVGNMLPTSVPLGSLPTDGLTEVGVQVATAPSDQVGQDRGVHAPPVLCRSDATIHGLHLGTMPPENHLLPAQQQVITQPRAPEVEAYILNTMSSDFEMHNVLPHLSHPPYNRNNNFAVPHSLGDERNFNDGMALWDF